MDYKAKCQITSDVRSYLQAWVDKDYVKMYSSLSRETQRNMTADKFVYRMNKNTLERSEILSIVSVCVANTSFLLDKAEVKYKLLSRNTELRQNELRSNGVTDFSNPVRISTSVRKFVFEHGKWRMLIIPTNN